MRATTSFFVIMYEYEETTQNTWKNVDITHNGHPFLLVDYGIQKRNRHLSRIILKVEPFERSLILHTFPRP